MVTYIIKKLASRGSIVHSRAFEHKNKTRLNRNEAQNPAYREDALVIGEVNWEARGCSRRLRASSSCSKSLRAVPHRLSCVGNCLLCASKSRHFFQRHLKFAPVRQGGNNGRRDSSIPSQSYLSKFLPCLGNFSTIFIRACS